MLVILFCMAAGFLAHKLGYLGGQTDQKLCRLLLGITMPCLILGSVSSGDALPAIGEILSILKVAAIYYYTLFAVTLIIFHSFLGRTTRNFADNLGNACKSILVGLIALYGLNELVYRLTRMLVNNHTNLNDTTISAQIHDAPRVTLLIVIFLAPFVEEVLFRGLVFGNLKSKSRTVAYVVSCLLFALLHVWQFAVVRQDITYFLLMVQYLVPGLVLAWAYDHTGTLWSSILLHAAANALHVLAGM